MSFDVSRADVDAVGGWMASVASQVGEQLSMAAAAARDMANLQGFQGSAAESVKAYWGEMHAAAATALAASLSEVAMRYAAYMDGYGDIDGSRDARFEESALAGAYSGFVTSRVDFAGKGRSLASALSPVGDLVGTWTPGPGALDDGLADLAEKARSLSTKVSAHEDCHAAKAASCEELISAARSLVSALGSGVGAASYAPGSIASMSFAPALFGAFSASVAYQRGAASSYQASLEGLQQRVQQRRDDELAKERANKGLEQMIGAGITVAFGAAAVVFTGGAAIPVVVGLFVAASAFQASNFAEGFQNYVDGNNHDISSLAFNPLRDTVFLGNQQAYDLGEFVTTAAAGAASPVAGAVGAARAEGASALKVVGQGAKAFGKDFLKSQATDLGVTVAVDPIIHNTLGDGVEGDVASKFVHEGAGFIVGLGGEEHSVHPDADAGAGETFSKGAAPAAGSGGRVAAGRF